MFIFFLLLAVIVIGFIIMNQKKPTKPQIVITKTVTRDPNHVRPIFAPSAKNKAILQALCFIGKADGQMRQEECNAMIQFLIEKQPEHKISHNEFLTESIRGLKKISYQEYKQTIAAMNKEELAEFIKWTNRIIGTQSTVHPFEEVLLDNLLDSMKNLQEINQAVLASSPTTAKETA